MRSIHIVCLALLHLLAVASSQAAEPTFRGRSFAEWRERLEKGDTRSRCCAATALGLGPFGKQSVPVLIKALADPDDDIRRSAAMALGYLGPMAAPAIPSLTALVSERPREATIVLEAFRRIGPLAWRAALDVSETRRKELGFAIGADDTLPPRICLPKSELLYSELLNGEQSLSNEVRQSIIFGSIEELGPAAAASVPVILDFLKRNEAAPARSAALNALAAIGPAAESAVPTLEAMLWRDVESLIMPEVLNNLGMQGQAALLRATRHSSASVQALALLNLARSGADIAPILHATLNDPDTECRPYALRGLGYLRRPCQRSLTALLKRARDKDEELHLEAVFALSRMRPPHKATIEFVKHAIANDNTNAWHLIDDEDIAFIPELRPLVVKALRSSDTQWRITAIQFLTKHGSADVKTVDLLITCLTDASYEVRLTAVEALARLTLSHSHTQGCNAANFENVIAIALKARLSDPEYGVRLSAASALVRLDKSRHEIAFWFGAELLKREVYLPHREGTCSLLCALGPDAAPALPWVCSCLYSEESDVRKAALRVLKAMGPRAKPALPILWLKMRDPTACDPEVYDVLGALGESGIPLLKRGLANFFNIPRRLAMRGLAQSGPAARSALEAVLEEAKAPINRLEALRALTAMGIPDPRIPHAATTALTDKYETIRAQACITLGAFGPLAAPHADALQDCLLDEHSVVRAEAVRALACILKPADATPLLTISLSDPDEKVRRVAVEALASLGTAACAAVPVLNDLVRDAKRHSNAVPAVLATLKLGATKDQAIKALSILLDTAPPATRIEAAKALWKLDRTGNVVPALTRMLEDRRQRDAATEALLSLDHAAEELLAFLKPMLHHPHYDVRAAAWRILVKQAPEAARKLVVQ